MEIAELTKHKAFVLIPFDKEFKDIYEQLIVPALEEEDFEVHKADSSLDQQNILKDIVHGIVRADLVVAELTSQNANVMYELGIAHGLRKPTVLLTQAIEDVPFDLRSYRVIHYSTDFREVTGLQSRLRQIAQKFNDESITFGNPVSDFGPQTIPAISARGEVRVGPSVGTPAPEEILEEEEHGWLDYAVAGEGSMSEITGFWQRIADMTNTLTQKMISHAERVEAEKSQLSFGSSRRMQQIASDLASDMTQYAQEVKGLLPGFHGSWERLEDHTAGLLSKASIETDEERDTLDFFESQAKGVQEVTVKLRSATRSAKNSLKAMWGVSKDLNHAIRETEGTMQAIIDECASTESRVVRILNLVGELRGRSEHTATSSI
ncbi:MAG: hypothetical protein FJY66_01860 [Calditrichaeota bacterium]|nr:hypothetical protein [Calditrichota bacterium]